VGTAAITPRPLCLSRPGGRGMTGGTESSTGTQIRGSWRPARRSTSSSLHLERFLDDNPRLQSALAAFRLTVTGTHPIRLTPIDRVSADVAESKESLLWSRRATAPRGDVACFGSFWSGLRLGATVEGMRAIFGGGGKSGSWWFSVVFHVRSGTTRSSTVPPPARRWRAWRETPTMRPIILTPNLLGGVRRSRRAEISDPFL